ncbi:MAG: hypothetical protein A4E63_00245 [Syntrophorhabdus sp. PtaU1.Bin050]|nr:MAG: hypothetical protein A4E63_00245 [Syntrophorhabdus sp. PtaU1.Bin050]
MRVRILDIRHDLVRISFTCAWLIVITLVAGTVECIAEIELETEFCFMNFLYQVANCSVALLLGAVGGGLVGAVVVAIVTWKKTMKSNTAYELLKEALQIQALKEAWIYNDRNFKDIHLSDIEKRDPLTGFVKVEVRTVLDESPWNFPEKNFFAFACGGKTWIVRNHIQNQGVETNLVSYPAIVSSRAMEELSGWIEKVYIAKSGGMLSADGLSSLKPLLGPLLSIGVIEEFKMNKRVSEKAYDFFKSNQFTH